MSRQWNRTLATLSPSQLYLLYSASLAAAFGTIIPLFAIYFRHAGLTLFQIALLAFIFEGTILLSELPTGVIADLRGRVHTLRAASALLTVSGVLFIIARNLTLFTAAEVLAGIGEACRSGSAEAWVSVRLQHTGEGDLNRLFARRVKLNFAASFVAMLLGGLVAQLYLPAGWVLFTLLALFSVLVSVTMNEAESNAAPARPLSFLRHLRSGIRAISGSSHLAATLFLLLAGNFAYEGVDQYWQVYLQESRSLAAIWFGVATAATALILFLIAERLVPWLREQLGFRTGITVLTLCGGIALALFALVGGVAALLACFVGFSVLRHLQEPMITGYVSDNSPAQARATVLSTNNLVASAGEMVAALTLGWLAAAAGLRPVFIAGVGLILVGWVCFYLIFGRNGEKNVATNSESLAD